MRGIFSFLRNSKGQSLIEFALILPFLLVLIGGVVDFGLSLFVGHVIQNAAREGARAGAVLPPVGTSFPATAATITGVSCFVLSNCSGNPSVILDKANLALPQVRLLEGFTITSTFMPSETPNQDGIQVEIKGAYQWFLLQLIFSDNSMIISRSATMRWEWQE